MKKSKLLYLSQILFVIICFYSCKNKVLLYKDVGSDTLLTKTIVFPDNLYMLDSMNFCKIESFLTEKNKSNKIISIVDGNCPKCIFNQINNVDSFFNKTLNDNFQMIFVLNVSSEDSVFFMRNMQPLIKIKGILLWDNNYNFEEKNKLFTRDRNLRTFMIDRDSRIIQYGNPILNPNVISGYQEKISKK